MTVKFNFKNREIRKN